MYSRIVFVVLVLLAIACCAYAECYNEDTCYKDYVTAKDKDVVVAVNRDTSVVELYWSEKDNTWLKPDAEYQQELQKIYKRKLRMIEAQKRMDETHRESWYNTSQAQYGHR